MEKLKQRVVSSSSRVIASLQQAAAVATAATPPSSAAATPSSKSSRLAAAAHLTEKEREILREVFKKEEQFQRETIKQMAGRTGQQLDGAEHLLEEEREESSPLGRFMAQSTPLSASSSRETRGQTRPRSTVPRDSCAGRAREQRDSRELGSIGGGRRANSACSAAGSRSSESANRQEQQCRICRKQIPSCEPSHLCSTCNQFICDDCASYSSSDQHWMCSSCRRRATKPAIPADALRELGLNQDSSAVRRMTLRLNQAELKQVLAGKKAPPAPTGLGPAEEPAGGRESRQQQVAPSSTTCSEQRSNTNCSVEAQQTKSGPAQQLRPAEEQVGSTNRERKAGKEANEVRASESTQRAAIGRGRRASQQQGVRTLVTASSERSLSGSLHELQRPNRIHSVSAQGSTASGVNLAGYSAGSQLIPSLIPADQIHLRRLSDQSNLVRRSSIISANSKLNLFASARNRSHSNIDTAAAQYYGYSSPPAAPNSSITDRQRRPSYGDPWAWQQQPASNTGSREQMSSLITSYACKKRRRSDSGDKIHSDSSSDINEPDNVNGEILTEGGFFSPPGQVQQPAKVQPMNDWAGHAFSAVQPADPQQLGGGSFFSPPAQTLGSHFLELSPNHDMLTGNQHQYQRQHRASYCSAFELNSEGSPPAPNPSIPSVSVSEFSSSQQRLLQHLAKQQQQHSAHHDPTLSTPSQINLAIEQAIQRQQHQRRQSQAAALGSAHPMELIPSAYLAPRRASSGRVLPKIPGEQSRSLLELPQFGSGSNGFGANGDSTGRAGQTGSTLDLPCLSPTVRRASAPEGQNIKIVVDDMDTSALASIGSGNGATTHSAILIGQSGLRAKGKQVGQLYEQLVLYRDDSIDPNTNMPRGFGLQLMGGKILPDEENLQACVTWVLPGGPADKLGICRGDRIIEWDGKCLVNMTYEQVAEVVESSANIAELLVKPATRLQVQPNYVRSQRRLSQQTERDLRRHSAVGQQITSNGYQHRLVDDSSSIQQQPLTRLGTGRRLPQIPGAKQLQDANISSSSTSRLEQIDGYINSAQADANYLAASRHEQQSHSTGELYSSQAAIGKLDGQQQLHQLSFNVINEFGAANDDKLSLYQHYPNQSDHYARLSASNRMADEICGLIGLQVNVDECVSQLEISILSAINIVVNPSYDYYVRIKILPENNRFKACSTQPSSDLNWKETFIFQNFPTQQIHRMALEIGIWTYEEFPRLSAQMAQPICEALIPIQSARERNIDFWPMRAPPTSPQVRRKSLNNLIEIHSRQDTNHRICEYEHQKVPSPRNSQLQDMLINEPASAIGKSLLKIQATGNQYQNELLFTRERSSSNRNLPITNKIIHNQPRRASDEVASNSSHRLSIRGGSTNGRRSISVMNVGDGLLSRPSSRLGSQSNILRLRKDSAQRLDSHQNSPTFKAKQDGSPTTSGSQTPVGFTPSGRRSSLVGIHSMSGYRSQKNSQSGSTDQDTSMKTTSRIRTATFQNNSSDTQKLQRNQQQQQKNSQIENLSIQSEKSTVTSTSTQRKGSFAMQTLRKLKRTMSLNKGNENEAGSNQDSRRSSLSSNLSDTEVDEDLAVVRRLLGQQSSVGRLKVSFIITKGQLEVDIICAHGLKFDYENSLGVYVKLYLKEKSKTNKRKTRLVQPCESPQLKQVIKYDASLVDNKSLDVSVWQKQGGLKGKNPIGFTEIQLRELNLATLQTSWYNLRPLDIICNSSIDD